MSSSVYLSNQCGLCGLISINDLLHSYQVDLLAILCSPQHRLPSYSTLRRGLLTLDYKAYSLCLAKFFQIDPLRGETIALDGKVLRGSYTVWTPASTTDSYRACQQIVESGNHYLGVLKGNHGMSFRALKLQFQSKTTSIRCGSVPGESSPGHLP